MYMSQIIALLLQSYTRHFTLVTMICLPVQDKNIKNFSASLVQQSNIFVGILRDELDM